MSEKISNIKCVFINGQFSENDSTIKTLLPQVIFKVKHGLHLEVPEGTIINEPIHLLFMNTKTHSQKHNLYNNFIIKKHSEVSIIEEHFFEQAFDYESHFKNEVTISNHASFHYYKIQEDHISATHHAHMHIEQQQESRVHTFSFLKGSQQASDSISLSQQQSGAESYLYGLYVLTQDQQNFTQQVHVDHIGTNGTSSMVYKGILDKKSRAAFHGKAYVHPETKNINAAQQNHHLLLSDQAEANSKPQLEIYAEDVKCTHGATVGRLNDEALFYLLTRGIEKNLARHLLIDGFAAEVYSKIKNPIIKEYIQHKMGHQHE